MFLFLFTCSKRPSQNPVSRFMYKYQEGHTIVLTLGINYYASPMEVTLTWQIRSNYTHECCGCRAGNVPNFK